MNMTHRPNCDTGPLEFMTVLSLLPPYSLDDVNSAYRAKALETHPDRGGTVSKFVKVQEAYERAVEYIGYCGDRRKWIADRVDSYRRQGEAAAEVRRLGGQVEFEEVDWLRQSVGDFAWLAERLRIIRLANTAAGDSFLEFLAEEPLRTPYLLQLDLSGTRVSDKGLQALPGLHLLQRLDLSRTKATRRAVSAIVESLPALEELGLAGTSIGWLSRRRLHASLRRRKEENDHWKFFSKLTEADG
jgi:DnaJ domain